jgi:probable rRNA maturation factor
MTVEVLNETEFTVNIKEISDLVQVAMKAMKIHPQSDLSVIFVDEEAMSQLHQRWMNEPGPTDVLSFPMDELRPGDDDDAKSELLLGDIVICPSVAATQAVAAGHETSAEIRLLTVHGFLHLIGFDHEVEVEHREMFGLQDKILSEFSELKV